MSKLRTLLSRVNERKAGDVLLARAAIDVPSIFYFLIEFYNNVNDKLQ